MKDFELEIKISIPLKPVAIFMVIASIVLLCFSALRNFDNIKSIPVSALGITTGFIIFQLGLSFFENRKKSKSE
ncbi:TPA: hypothetical protein ACSVPQ_002563 [Clostridioides difficile]|uniref:hypothetical protein n=1 Tax=Clostridioides difficile TaxID=1496 RepID=UPI000BB17547|nr:hypothetical protein [Clostridioides difficile]EGT3642184.1 hypothetical protein [Clostridioides difficile]MBH7168552.1 hypothetical protein [Clostridioides difficile]MBH7847407.1 hypothetical protein [Clostridioides difficile]MBY1346125.1 hypothetical protein [Clostridioides difficile]MBY1660891.1 hypothetical protein [Clostridioides difficile]